MGVTKMSIQAIEKKTETFVCDYCDANTPVGERCLPTETKDEVCTYCYENFYMACDDCDAEYADGDGLTEIKDLANTWVCDNCRWEKYFYCDRCKEWFAETNYLANLENSVCEGCYDNGDYGWCERCDQYYHDYCDDCPDDDDEDGLYPYSYKPEPKFFGSASGLFLGVELEVEACKTTQSNVANIAYDCFGSNRIYCKRDGSLDYGVEIVTHPHSPQAIHQLDWEGLTTRLKEAGARSWDPKTCGFHIHVNKEFLGADGLGFFIIMAYASKAVIEKVAGRTNSTWASWNRDVSKFASDYRYMAINLVPTNTVEIRVFRGTLNPVRLRAYMELVTALALYARHVADDISNLSSYSLTLSAALRFYESKYGRAYSLRGIAKK